MAPAWACRYGFPGDIEWKFCFRGAPRKDPGNLSKTWEKNARLAGALTGNGAWVWWEGERPGQTKCIGGRSLVCFRPSSIFGLSDAVFPVGYWASFAEGFRLTTGLCDNVLQGGRRGVVTNPENLVKIHTRTNFAKGAANSHR